MAINSVIFLAAVALTALNWERSRAVCYLENTGYWTLRLRVALVEPFVLATWALVCSAAAAHTLWSCSASLVSLASSWGQPRYVCTFSIYLGICVSLIQGLSTAHRQLKKRQYLAVRWKSWSGPSRTGIPPNLAEHIGGVGDWVWQSQTMAKLNSHPVDRFSKAPGAGGIFWDPTDILKAQPPRGGDLTPQSKSSAANIKKAGVYQPYDQGTSVSLLWGRDLGFQPRCSRGVISVPRYLLRASPVLENGLSGEALCLAYSILARNKGLEPRSLVCNLGLKNSFRQWEEAGLWPHPAKTLRSFYYKELHGAFSHMGESYVTAATELALLIADLDYSTFGWWLDQHFEHQDLQLNWAAHALGASTVELSRLYRGHYAAMLISLNVSPANARPRVRPELVVFDAICRLDQAPVPDWASAPDMVARRRAEADAYGPSLEHLVQAII